MPDKHPNSKLPERKVRGLYFILRDHRITSPPLAQVSGLKIETIRKIARNSGRGISAPKVARIDAFLRFIKIPENDIAGAWKMVTRPAGEHRYCRPDPKRRAWLTEQAVKFNAKYPVYELPEPEPVNLLDMEVPVLNRQMLSVAACQAFDLLDREGNAVDPFFAEYKDPAHGEYRYPAWQDTFDELMRAARQRAMIALTAPPASGKTFLLDRVRLALQKKGYYLCEPRLLTKRNITEGSILNAILAEIAGQGIKPRHRIDDRCNQIYQLLTEDKGMRKVVLIIDEAQELPALALRCLKRLYDWNYGVFDNLLSIFLVGHNLLGNMLRGDLSIQETGRRCIIFELPPLDSITGYLNWRLSKALNRPSNIRKLFTPEGLKAVENLLDKPPRTRADWRPMIVNNLVCKAFEQAYQKGESQISEGIISEIVQDVRKQEQEVAA